MKKNSAIKMAFFAALAAVSIACLTGCPEKPGGGGTIPPHGGQILPLHVAQ